MWNHDFQAGRFIVLMLHEVHLQWLNGCMYWVWQFCVWVYHQQCWWSMLWNNYGRNLECMSLCKNQIRIMLLQCFRHRSLFSWLKYCPRGMSLHSVQFLSFSLSSWNSWHIFITCLGRIMQLVSVNSTRILSALLRTTTLDSTLYWNILQWVIVY